MRYFRRKVIAYDPTPTPMQELLASIYLYINWKYITRQLTTEQKEMLADAIDHVHAYNDAMECQPFHPVPRWWRDDYQEDK